MVLDFVCPVWHSSLTDGQTESLESLQRRAMRIIHPQIDCRSAMILDDIDSLQDRREHLTQIFFTHNVLDSDSCLHYLLPEPRNPEIISRLRYPRTYEIPLTRTEHFLNSFIPYCLTNYQWQQNELRTNIEHWTTLFLGHYLYYYFCLSVCYYLSSVESSHCAAYMK